MKKVVKKSKEDELRPEYDLSELKRGVRGKYCKRFRAGTNLVYLEPDVAKVFADDESVNEALRSLIKVANAQVLHSH